MKKLFIWYSGFFIIFTLFYLLLFHTPLFVGQKVLFFRGIYLLIFLSAVSLFAGGMISRKTKYMRLESVVAAVVMSACLHLTFFVVFPVTFDRSVTMYLLNKINSSSSAGCSGITKANLQREFISEYLQRKDAIGRRLNEQAITDFVTKQDMCISLTSKGKEFVDFSRLIMKVYGLK